MRRRWQRRVHAPAAAQQAVAASTRTERAMGAPGYWIGVRQSPAARPCCGHCRARHGDRRDPGLVPDADLVPGRHAIHRGLHHDPRYDPLQPDDRRDAPATANRPDANADLVPVPVRNVPMLPPDAQTKLSANPAGATWRRVSSAFQAQQAPARRCGTSRRNGPTGHRRGRALRSALPERRRVRQAPDAPARATYAPARTPRAVRVLRSAAASAAAASAQPA